MRRPLLIGLACLALAALPAVAAAPVPLQLAGVPYPAQVTVAGQPLVLNGAGIRYRFVVQVYTAGLYLSTPAGTAEQALAATGPKRLHIVMLREIDGDTLGKLFTRGMEDNSTRAQFAKAIPGTLRLAELFALKKRLVAGENFTIDWLPGRGTQILVNGTPQGEPIAEPEFYAALMRIWLGPRPADEVLKRQLLGEKPREAATQTN